MSDLLAQISPADELYGPVSADQLDGLLSDGFGSSWDSRCPECGAAMQVVRPGEAVCSAECFARPGGQE